MSDADRVLIVGGGPAGLEALIALRELAAERVSLTLLALTPDFNYKPLAVAEPFHPGTRAATTSRRSPPTTAPAS